MHIFNYILFFSIVSHLGSRESQTVLSSAEKRQIIDTHNYWRGDVGVYEKVRWSDKLAQVAERWARALKRKGCGFAHSPDNPHGENLFKGTTGYYSPIDVVNAWAEEKAFYDYDRNECTPGEMCGHYTQVVWRSTREVGCAKIQCDGMDIWVCEYDPPGNWIGQKPY